MSTQDDREKSREESPRLRANGFTKMAEEHEQIAQAIERPAAAGTWFAAQREAPPGRG